MQHWLDTDVSLSLSFISTKVGKKFQGHQFWVITEYINLLYLYSQYKINQ